MQCDLIACSLTAPKHGLLNKYYTPLFLHFKSSLLRRTPNTRAFHFSSPKISNSSSYIFSHSKSLRPHKWNPAKASINVFTTTQTTTNPVVNHIHTIFTFSISHLLPVALLVTSDRGTTLAGGFEASTGHAPALSMMEAGIGSHVGVTEPVVVEDDPCGITEIVVLHGDNGDI